MVTGVPWKLIATDEKADGETYTAVQLQPGEVEQMREPNLEATPRSFAISKQDWDAWLHEPAPRMKGTLRQGHTRECRLRFEQVLRGTEKLHKVERTS